MRLSMIRTDLLADVIAFFKSGQCHYDRPLNVRFEGEPAVDGGGPRREFFSLLLQRILSPTSQYRLFKGRLGRYLRCTTLMHWLAAYSKFMAKLLLHLLCKVAQDFLALRHLSIRIL